MLKVKPVQVREPLKELLQVGKNMSLVSSNEIFSYSVFPGHLQIYQIHYVFMFYDLFEY